jgi:hypothetical protein
MAAQPNELKKLLKALEDEVNIPLRPEHACVSERPAVPFEGGSHAGDCLNRVEGAIEQQAPFRGLQKIFRRVGIDAYGGQQLFQQH